MYKMIIITMGTILLTSVGASARAAGDETGASGAWTSTDPVVTEARRLFEQGSFGDAELVLRSAPEESDEHATRARAEMLEIIARTRREYALDPDSMLRKLRPAIPDITAGDVERWRDTGQIQHRIIDGEVAYFRREPSNLWRFSDEARQRRDAHAAETARPPQPKPTFVLEEHLAEVIAAAEATGRAEVLPVRHRIRYTLTVKPDRPGARDGAVIRCWLPFPQEWDRQREVKLISASPEPHLIAPGAVEGDPIAGALQRTIYFEQRIEDPSRPHAFTVEFEYITSAYYPTLDDALAEPLPEGFPRQYLEERPPHIRFTRDLKHQVEQIIGDESNPLARARRIFHWIDGNIRYCAEEEYGIIPSFSDKALTARRGDCGIQAMLFITMCRYAGIPARWQSGWETKPVGWNMHDWAEFYVAPWGWLPADVSYGLRNPDPPANAPDSPLHRASPEQREQIREFYFGHQDSYRLIVNVDYGMPLHPPKQSLRSEPADFQRGEVEIDGRNLYFDEWTG
jgi:transglutaminase-like putative cysteine protease